MARPCKSAELLTECSQTKGEVMQRTNGEKVLRGSANKIRAPSYLSKPQKQVFNTIVSELKASGILGNLDVYILAQCSIAIDRMQTIEQMISNDPSLLFDTKLMGTKNKYATEFFRCCNELSLSPQSRAKMANINIQDKRNQEDPVLTLLRGGKP